MLQPADIESKRFTVTRIQAGYSQGEVDDFLDRVADAYTEQAHRIAQLERELGAARRPVFDAGAETIAQPSMASVERMLVVAQQTADKQVAEAHAEAGQLRAEAEQEGEKARYAAKAEAERVLAEAEAERARVTADVNALKVLAQDYRAWLNGALGAFNAELSKEEPDA